MDLLATPASLAFPADKTPYVCKEAWDGGAFLTYALRKGRSRSVPPNLRRYYSDGEAATAEATEEYLELLYPTPQKEQESFFQTWFFFGLLAEFLGLNETQNAERFVSAQTSAQELAALCDDFTVEEDGSRYLTGSKLLEPQIAILIMERLRGGKPDLVDRIQYLHKCLLFTAHMLGTAIHTAFDPTIRFSISALGEFFSTALTAASSVGRIPKGIAVFGFNWNAGFIPPGSDLEAAMLVNGWCTSEIEKVKHMCQGLSTLHFLSRIKKHKTREGSHGRCSRDGCIAFQLDVNTYRPSHVKSKCSCDLLFIDNEAVASVLKTTSTFPVLQFTSPDENDPDQRTRLCVEPHTSMTPYVAISHVWADGMGNPSENALPECQIARVARLVLDLERSVDKLDESAAPKNYRLWIDPLLCPVESEGKSIALQRITDVYRKATHVLVLDASIMQYRVDQLAPAETLLRMFSCSAWMRRLWTLQEGALAKSLYFQFADKAVPVMEPFQQLFQEGQHDSRLMRIWMDISTEIINLRGWFNQQPELAKPTLVNLQSALHFRTVSNPSDEPLCIAALLELDLKSVVAIPDGQARMSRVWELISRSSIGIPPGIIFSLDETLDIPGWRWAPKSLLGASAPPEGVMGISSRLTRFRNIPRVRDNPRGNEALGSLNGDILFGIPTRSGLRVQFSGFLLKASPLLPGGPLLPWKGIIKKPREDLLMAKERSSGRWLKIADFHRSHKLATWSTEERRAYDTQANNPLSRAVRSGKCAIIYDASSINGDTFHGLLAEIDNTESDNKDHPGAVIVRRLRMLVINKATSSSSLASDILRALAARAAAHPDTQNLLGFSEQDRIGQDYQDALDKVRDVLKQLMAETWATNPAFVQAIHDTVGPDMEEFMWARIPMAFSYDIVCEELPSSQIWIVD